MHRNLVICFDGTNNEFGPENTNVVRLVQVLNRDPAKQHLYYDPGVGTLPEPSAFSAVQKWMSKVAGLAFGAGLAWKVQEAYCFLMNFWEPGDKVYLFGFSRGAYTARVLAGLLHCLGLMPHGNDNLVPYAMRLYKAVRRNRDRNSEHWKLCDEFRWTFARRVEEGDDNRRFPVHFLGLWDTVASVGWVWDPPKFPFTACNPSVEVVRHAVSVDERRWFFRENVMRKPEAKEMTGIPREQDLRQLWFPGSHCDVGGGYLAADGLWRVPFQWILDEATNAGMLVNESRRARVLNEPPPPQRPWAEPQNESLTPPWWPAEFFPKLRRRRNGAGRVLRIGRGRHRYIDNGQLIHESTLERIREPQVSTRYKKLGLFLLDDAQTTAQYSPPNFPTAFLEQIRRLESLPAALEFEC